MLSQEQIQALLTIIGITSFKGSEVEFVAELKKTLEQMLESSKNE